MATNSKIEWTDHTFNPWSGCSKVHAGCTHCYAENNYSVKMRGVQWGPSGTRVMTAPATWIEPLKWNRQAMAWPLHVELCKQMGVADPILEWERRDDGRLPDPALMRRPRVFCASLADVFEDWQGEIRDHHGKVLHRCKHGHVVGLGGVHAFGADCIDGCNAIARAMNMDDLRRDLFALIDATPYLDWLLLTKRPENIRRMWAQVGWGGYNIAKPHASVPGRGRSNVWLGTSISDQATTDQYVPELLKCHDLAPVRFLSAEPLLGPIDLSFYLPTVAKADCEPAQLKHYNKHFNFDWVIVGGESGRNARRCEVPWIESLVSQCRDAAVPVFVKQLGAHIADRSGTAVRWMQAGVKAVHALPGATLVTTDDPKGGDWDEWPADLRVREFPEVAS